jgi:hypothetical protein
MAMPFKVFFFFFLTINAIENQSSEVQNTKKLRTKY